MNYKVEGALRKNKKYFIIFAILWLFIAIVLIVPITVGYNTAVTQNGTEGLSKFVETITNPFSGIGQIFSNNLLGAYLRNLGIFSIIFAIFFIAFIISSLPP